MSFILFKQFSQPAFCEETPSVFYKIYKTHSSIKTKKGCEKLI